MKGPPPAWRKALHGCWDQAACRAGEWLEEMLAVPKQEFPEFPAALSHVMMLTPGETLRD